LACTVLRCAVLRYAVSRVLRHPRQSSDAPA
jgi:hypothetical protein